MKENPHVSVIIPVWNPGSGISRCVESLRSQTLEDIEMIFVDDCGTDGAMGVVRTAAKEDPRIRIIENPENLGPGVSRNKGIEVARGEYLSFVDADDYIDTDFLEVLYHKGKTEDFDIVKGNRICEYEEGTIVFNSYNLYATIQEGLKDGKPLFFLFHDEHQSALYHGRLFVNPDVRFGLTTIGEDTIFLLKACHAAKSFGIDNRVAYHYLCRMSSASNSFSEKSVEAKVTALRARAEYLSNHVEPNPYAVLYITRSIKHALLFPRYLTKIGMEKESAQFLYGLRKIAMEYPNIGKVKDLTIHALVEYGVGLAERPYYSPWEVPRPEDYADVVVRRVNFLQSHPEYYKKLPAIVSKAKGFVKQMKSDGISKEEIEAYEKQIRALWRRPSILKMWNEIGPKVSVIIPVWNPGPGISHCIDSLRCQTLIGIEMIFVDDCGSDGAMDAVRSAAAEDPRIRIIANKKNMGAGASRNAGIEAARGEYLSFVDADDYVDSDFLEVLYRKGKAENLDIVKGRRVCEYEEGTTKSNSCPLNDVIQRGLKDGYPLFLLFSYEHQSALFHRRLFLPAFIRYGLSRNAQDTTFLLKACHAAKSFEIDDHVAYHYIYRNDSASNVITKASLESRIEALRNKVEFLVTCVEPNPYAIQYFINWIKNYLSLERYVSKKGGMEKEAMEFLTDLQAIASNYPAIGIVKDNDMTIFALVDYSEGLAERPYHLPWEVSQPEDYADVVVRSVNFLQSHPEYNKELPALISKAKGFAKQMKSDGISEEEIEAYERQIRALWWKPLLLWMLFKNKVRRMLAKLKRRLL